MSSLDSAIFFLNKIVNQQNEILGEADLVLATYDFENGMDLDMIDRFVPSSSNSNDGSIGQTKNIKCLKK